jgi:hypothetical protein
MSFGSHGAPLKAAIEKKAGNTLQWVASNCGCGTAMTTGFSVLFLDRNQFQNAPRWQREQLLRASSNRSIDRSISLVDFATSLIRQQLLRAMFRG